jgi:hypothetical protein
MTSRKRSTSGLSFPSARVVIDSYREVFDKDPVLRDALLNFENEFLDLSMQIAGTLHGGFKIKIGRPLVHRVPKWWIQHYLDKAGYDVYFDEMLDEEMVLRVELRTCPKRERAVPPPLPESPPRPAPVSRSPALADHHTGLLEDAADPFGPDDSLV